MRSRWMQYLLEQQGKRCALCGFRFPLDGELHPSAESAWRPTFDHIIPKAYGGWDALENLQLAHRICNVRKGDGTTPRAIPALPRKLRH